MLGLPATGRNNHSLILPSAAHGLSITRVLTADASEDSERLALDAHEDVLPDRSGSCGAQEHADEVLCGG